MLTANEIRNITFNKSMGGYKVAEVDVFVDQCAETVAALTNAKVELEKKLEVLADKLVEYRNDEDSIRTALLSAQRLGDTVVREANHKAGLILEDANIKAQKIRDIAEQSIKSEEKELERIRREVTSFKARMLSIYREHLALIDILPEEDEEEPQNTATENHSIETAAADYEAAAQTAEEPAAEMTKAPKEPGEQKEENIPSQAEEPAFEPVVEPVAVSTEPAPSPETFGVVLDIPVLEEEEAANYTEEAPASHTTSSSRFGDLKFGEAYDISKDTDDDDRFLKRRK